MADRLKIYNASAGSGKTYTLVQEYLSIVLKGSQASWNPERFRHILAMTFTNKAADEMKQRILQGLITLSKREAEKSDKEKKFTADTVSFLSMDAELAAERSSLVLNKLLHHYGAFSVMTIDKFTHKVIRTFSRDLNLSIDFDVELDESRLRRSVTDLLFDQIGRNEELTSLMKRYANANLADDKSWNFSKDLFEFSKNLFKENAIESIERLKKLSAADFLKIQESLIASNKKFENQLKGLGELGLEMIRSNGLSAEDFAGKTTSGITSLFAQNAAGNVKSPTATHIKNVEEGNWGHKTSPNKAIADGIASDLEKIYHQIVDLIEKFESTYILNKEILKNINNLSLLNHLVQLLDDLKDEDNILLISDFHKKIAEVIANEPVPFIYERLGVKYQYFLLDEFQDTSHLQWVNTVPLLYNSLASGYENLIVGDGKQAIYRWRNGEVEQFARLPEEIYNPGNIESLNEASYKFKEEGKLIPLDKNYRSAAEIIGFNNDLFEHILNENKDSIEHIYKGFKQIPTKDFKGYVELNFEKDLESEDQLEYVLASIKKCEAANYEWKDICVLVRNKTDGSQVARFLSDEGIDVISQDSLLIGKDLGVKFLISLISATAYPANRNFKIKSLEHFANYVLEKDVSTIVDENLDKLHLPLWKLLQPYQYQIKSIEHFHNFYEFVESLIAAFDLNLSNNPYLQFFLEKVHEFEKRNSSDLRAFITWYNDKGKNESILSPKGANAVQIMTIHKAKGLQFPVVIFPFCDWTLKLSREIVWIQDTVEKLPSFFVNLSSKIEKTELEGIYNQEHSKFILDQINLLYVAFTRPERALFVSGNLNKSDQVSNKLLSNYLDSNQFMRKEGNFQVCGELVSVSLEADDPTQEYKAEFIKQVMDKPQMSFKSAENWDIDDLDEKRLFGTKVHQVLADLNNQDELEMVLQQHLRKGFISVEEKDSIAKLISKLFENLHFQQYFEGEIFNEQSILTGKGRKLIPDKIVVKENQTLVIDFKTGQESSAHVEQILTYVQILKELGFPNVKGEIFYTEEEKILKV